MAADAKIANNMMPSDTTPHIACDILARGRIFREGKFYLIKAEEWRFPALSAALLKLIAPSEIRTMNSAWNIQECANGKDLR
ncbi:hypothetical protein MPC4_80164 [Methylocella tundrae]|uniref:Uncharacterized protein n=1 Tax=Methylocella tundrae TaxID=227605 RepID=A0A8B6MBW0_METTU|nr:hypothetical protein MPC4_80164 [Methylocella tundrae]